MTSTIGRVSQAYGLSEKQDKEEKPSVDKLADLLCFTPGLKEFESLIN